MAFCKLRSLHNNVIIRKLSNTIAEEYGKKVSEYKIPVPWGHISGNLKRNNYWNFVIKVRSLIKVAFSGKWWGRTDVKPLIGLHGWQDNAGTFDTLIPLLPESISVLAIDIPGHGLSSWYPSSLYYNSLQGLLSLRRIVQYFKWNSVSILGHSMGSELGFLYASVFSDEVEVLIGLDLIKPVTVSEQYLVKKAGSIIDKTLKNHHIVKENSPKYTYPELVERLFQGYKGSLTKSCCDILLKRGKMQFPCGKYYYTRDPRLNSSTGLLSEYQQGYLMKLAKNIKCEVLNIKGKPGRDFEDSKRYYEAVDVIKRSAKRFEFHEVEGSHHFHLSNPIPTANLIANFLNAK